MCVCPVCPVCPYANHAKMAYYFEKVYFTDPPQLCPGSAIGIVALALKAILRSKKAEKGQENFET